jgi:DNA-binding response OmpR family regulator
VSQRSDGARDNELGLDVDLVRQRSAHQLALIVDDDEETVNLLKLTLRREGINVVSATSGTEALKVCVDTQPHVILLGIMMPGMDGWETMRQLRNVTNAPVVIISAILHEDAVVRAFSEGVVDYIKKPYSHKEIVARIQAILSRVAPPEPHQVMAFPESKLYIDLDHRQVKASDELVKLTPQEFSILVILAQNATRPVPYEALAEQVWGEYNAEVHNRMKWVIHSLRKKLKARKRDLIINYQRFGYLFQG